ncbi:MULTISPECIES: phosphate ABC transporter substrate-binding protein PstS [Bradyrhizobium]|jgi:phosphate transport system substrate-binding protein|uniref:phosphate ABC transporter substrate-binding protein PstS n=1 Tax=Bradyrhizobium TaxID=374 RepID=UPI00048147A2|nr:MULTISPECIES: phosphate ABC transporter substrate-binding protein PstS [Bradyrhizobium]MCS3453287.1 phosphate transport system substrate-binding protein [Bradyrhizobium elkanii]MCS3564605.1 phosphate transport system substrate-binding protein [Bradyrhizobium elkanii]MCW2145563.1 phosphate transport system substrate-binding protein [Bradyrhizobium elkanii]MCW2355619.1 phosphate transport system substrate-binding protein [Bradyrhizobium elkanii]MCW2378390.1 phosphate transport system substrat
MNFIKAIVAAGMIAASTSAFAADITGAGATFPFPIYSKWADAYKKETGNGLNYQSIGSGAGIKQIQAKTVTFGATDAPLKHEQLEKDGLVQWPMVMGAIVPVVNLEGIKPGDLILSGEVLGDIYLGKITKWNDAAIAKLNPKLTLPGDAITVVRRSDGSGTTFNFTDYLSKSNADWKSKVGSGTAVEWPVGVGAKGNEGVAGNISQTKNAIGYVEYAYAKQNKLTYTGLVNKAGKTVQPTIAAFQAAASNADWAKAPGYYVILTDQPGEASWPITAATFILMHKDSTDKAASQEALKFFKYAFEKGDKAAEELDYIPMPDSVVKLIEKTWSSDIKS